MYIDDTLSRAYLKDLTTTKANDNESDIEAHVYTLIVYLRG